MKLTPINVAKNILKEFTSNKVVQRELPIAVALAKRFIELEIPEAKTTVKANQKVTPTPVASKLVVQATSTFSLAQKASQTLKQQLLVAIKCNDWNKASELCLKLGVELNKQDRTESTHSSTI